MNSNEGHPEHDALEKLIRKYLAERGDSGMMEHMADTVLQKSPEVVPSPEREADMISRLKNRFPARPSGKKIALGWALRPTIAVVGTVAAAVALMLLLAKPNENTGIGSPTETNVLQGAGTADKADDAFRFDIPNVPDTTAPDSLEESSGRRGTPKK
jgi:hypothetical protein